MNHSLAALDADVPWPLPRSWAWVPLGELCTFVNGRAFKRSERSATGLPIIRIQNLTDHRKAFIYYLGPYDDRHRVREGDLLVSWSGTPGSSFGAFLWTRKEGLLNQHIFRVTYEARRVLPSYLMYSINRRLDALIRRSRGGVGLKHFTKEQLKRLSIPIPSKQDTSKSLEIQQAIVEKLERLRDSISAGNDVSTKMLNATNELLGSAFDDVLSNIRADTRSVKLGELAYIRNGRATGIADSGIRVFKTRHVYPHALRLDQPVFAPVKRIPADRFLAKDDILMANIAEGTLGRVTYVDYVEADWTVDSQVMILTANSSRVVPKWLYFFLWSRHGQSQILAKRTGIAFAEKRGQTHIYPRDVAGILITIPPMDVQRRAVAYLDSVLSQCEQMSLQLQKEKAALVELDSSRHPPVIERFGESASEEQSPGRLSGRGG